MAEIYDLQRLEDQLYHYRPDLKRDSEDVKSERRKRLYSQLRYSYPLVQLPAFDAVTSLVNIKTLLDKCKDSVLDSLDNSLEMEVRSPSTSLLESSVDECLVSQRPRRVSRKRKSSFFLNSDFGEPKTERKEQDSPLSLSILIPQVVKGSDKMEISIDLGGIDASQRFFGSRIDGLLRNRSNSTNTLEDGKESPGTSNKFQNLQMTTTSSCIQSIDSNEKQDDMLSRLISEVLVENNDSETLQATNVLDNINNNESSNYNAIVPVLNKNSKMPRKKRVSRKPKKEVNEYSVPKKRGRKPKNKTNPNLENMILPKSDLAKYVELFSNTCNMTGSTTPAASSTMSQQLVTSTTHYIDSGEQPITYYLEGDWENGGSCQLIQTENVAIDGGQEEFNMAELVNYIDNVGDAGNVIARVLDGPNTLPVLLQDSNSQNNAIAPPPAHVSDVLLDLSKKSTMVPNVIESRDIFNSNTEETTNHDIPLDLSLKSSKFIENSIALNTILTPPGRLDTVAAEVFDNNDYDSFRAALDMPLIDIDDNIKAFMELTNSEVITSENAIAAATTLTDCGNTVVENANNGLPVCNFELSGIIVENSDRNTENQNCNEFNNEQSCSGINSNKNGPTEQVTVTEIFESINTTVNTDGTDAAVGKCTEFEKTISTVNATDSQHIRDITETNNTLTTKDEHTAIEDFNQKGENNLQIADMTRAGGQFEITAEEARKNAETHTSTYSQNVNPTESYNSTVLNEFAEQEDITNKIPPKLIDIEDRIDTHDELQENLSDKSSIDFLFVDTESLPGHKLKYYYEEPLAGTSSKHLTKGDNDHIIDAGDQKNNQVDNDNFVCDLSTNDDNSKSIDLREECQGHSVNLHLPMPQLTLMDNSSEEFCYDYDIGFESADEKNLPNLAAKKRNFDENQRTDQNYTNISISTGDCCSSSDACNRSDIFKKTPVMAINGTKATDHEFGDKNGGDEKVNNLANENSAEIIDDGKENSTFEDSAVFCSQKYADVDTKIEIGKQDLNQSNNVAKSENFTTTDDNKLTLNIQAEKSTLKLSQQNMLNSNEKSVVKAEKSFTNLSVLEMESKLDNACLDFEDEIEDDALSLTTSYFNSSDDERLPEHDKGSSDKTVSVKDLKLKKSLNEENNTSMIEDSSDVTKLPTAQKVMGSSDHIFKKFKIPKISMTTATVKHGNPTVSVATTAPLPMVILPPNAFQKQSIKTESDATKSVGFEKITRTVQNVCAVTPLTLKHLNYTNTTTSTSTTANTLDTVAPLIRDMLQMTPPVVVEDGKDFNTGLGATVNSQHVNCTRGEVRGNGGDGRNFGPPTIVVAKTFGVTCLPFLVERCFTLPSCQFSHSFRDAEIVKNILSTLSELDLSIAYKFAYSHEIIFRQYMREFCKVYFERNNRFKLLNMVRDCERYRDGGELLITIFHSLINCGLNKVNACRQILSNSRDRSRTTIDALVDIILQADWTMFCDYIEKFSDISSYHFRLNVLHQMAPTILRANDQKMTSIFFKCLVNLDPKDVGLVQSSPILMQLLELIKNGQT